MQTVKEKVRSLLDTLPEDCTMEDIQYHLYVVEKVQRGIERAETEGTFTQEEVEQRFGQ
jgi:hypothetical protein